MKAIDVANFFITVGLMNEGTEMTNARINKLLYFAQGWHLAKTGEPLFNEKIEAWDYGPVIHSVYSEFKRYGKNIITEPSENFNLNLMQDDDFEFLSDVFTNYSDFSTSALINLTHKKDSPWDKTYIHGRNIVIPVRLMKEYFEALPDLHSTEDDIKKIPTVGYINDEGCTILPKECDD